MVTLKNWQERMSEDMRLHDFRERTQEAYLLAVRQLIDHLQIQPRAITEDHLRAYFLYLRDEKQVAPSTINVAIHGIRFFFLNTVKRDWAVLDLLRIKRSRTLPVVLSQPEVRTILKAVRHPVRRMAFVALYSLGLRINEGLSLTTGDIDSERLIVWVRDGKGAVDRGVPLPRPVLARLRKFWKTERPASSTKYLFVADNGVAPVDDTTLQKTFAAALAETRIDKVATPHTLRHSYATHLVEAGASLRTVQQVLGHKSLRTTEVYLHVTQPGVERLQEILDQLMVGF
ncbi:MAG: site-specific integrase [Byssovorax sp.]